MTNFFKTDAELGSKFQEVFDRISGFSDLTPSSKANLLEKTVNFQSSSIPLKSLMGTHGVEIDGELLARLIENDVKISVGPLLPQLSELDSNCYIERTFNKEGVSGSYAEIPDKIAIIAASPGMGKSVVLTHLANKEKKTDPSRWVVRVNLIEHKNGLNKEIFANYNLDKASEFLSKIMSLDGFTKELFKTNFQQTDRVSLFFDGFDEISPAYKDKVIILLKTLQQAPIAKLWITTRLHMRDNLEKALSLSAYELNPLSLMQQKEFFNKFFAYKLSFTGSYPDRLGLCVNKLYDTLFEKLPMAEELLKVPLQLKMIAEVVQQDFERFFTSLQVIFLLPENFNLLYLYEEFFKTKFDIYSRLREQDIRPSEKLSFDKFIKGRQHLALYSLFGEESVKLFYPGKMPAVTQLITSMEQGVGYVGVIDFVVNGSPQFTHHSFAEYLAATALTTFIGKNIENLTEFQRHFLRKSIYHPDNEMLRTFFYYINADFSLGRLIYQGNLAEIKKLAGLGLLDVNAKDSLGRSLLSLAAVSGEYEITEFLLQEGASVFEKDKVFDWTPLAFADASYGSSHNKLASSKLLEILLVNGANKEDMHFIEHFFYELANRQDYEAVAEVLTNFVKESYTNLLKASITFFRDAMMPHPQQEYTDGISGRLLADYDEEGNTLLHYAVEKDDEEIASYLLEQGSDPTIQNDENKTPVDLLIEKLAQSPNDEQKKQYKSIIGKIFQSLDRHKPVFIVVDQFDKLYSQIAAFYTQSDQIIDLDQKEDLKLQYYLELLVDIFKSFDGKQIQYQIEWLFGQSIEGPSRDRDLSLIEKQAYQKLATEILAELSLQQINEQISLFNHQLAIADDRQRQIYREIIELLFKQQKRKARFFSTLSLETFSDILPDQNSSPPTKRRRVERLSQAQHCFSYLLRLAKKFPREEKPLLKALNQAELFHAQTFRKKNLKTTGHCLQLTYGFSELILAGKTAIYLENLQTLSELEERIIHNQPLSERESRERREFLAELNQFEQEDSLPSWEKSRSDEWVKMNAFVNLVNEIEGDFAIHLSLVGRNGKPGHMLAIYRIDNFYTYFDSNAGYLSQIRDQENFLNFIEAITQFTYGIKSNTFLQIDILP